VPSGGFPVAHGRHRPPHQPTDFDKWDQPVDDKSNAEADVSQSAQYLELKPEVTAKGHLAKATETNYYQLKLDKPQRCSIDVDDPSGKVQVVVLDGNARVLLLEGDHEFEAGTYFVRTRLRPESKPIDYGLTVRCELPPPDSRTPAIPERR
jgi:hypothetical protein